MRRLPMGFNSSVLKQRYIYREMNEHKNLKSGSIRPWELEILHQLVDENPLKISQMSNLPPHSHSFPLNSCVLTLGECTVSV